MSDMEEVAVIGGADIDGDVLVTDQDMASSPVSIALKAKITSRLDNDHEGYLSVPDHQGDAYKVYAEMDWNEVEQEWIGYGCIAMVFDPVEIKFERPADA